MSLSAAVIRELIAAGLSGDALVAACERIEMAAPAPVVTVVDEQAERRREKDRERKARLPRDWSALRLDVFKRDGWACTYCGTPGDARSLHCDHVIPSSKGGSNDIENLTTACGPCNVRKKDRLDWVAP